MAARFLTKGPFKLGRTKGFMNADAFEAIWCEEPDLKKAKGVYIIATKVGTRLVPWYVGKSDLGFGSRFRQHPIFQVIGRESPNGDLYLFMLVRVTPKGKSMRAAKTQADPGRLKIRKLKSIDRLEYALIGTCLKLNANLLNEKLKRFHEGLVVPGYLPNPNQDQEDSAQQLAKMLFPEAKHKRGVK